MPAKLNSCNSSRSTQAEAISSHTILSLPPTLRVLNISLVNGYLYLRLPNESSSTSSKRSLSTAHHDDPPTMPSQCIASSGAGGDDGGDEKRNGFLLRSHAVEKPFSGFTAKAGIQLQRAVGREECHGQGWGYAVVKVIAGNQLLIQLESLRGLILGYIEERPGVGTSEDPRVGCVVAWWFLVELVDGYVDVLRSWLLDVWEQVTRDQEKCENVG